MPCPASPALSRARRALVLAAAVTPVLTAVSVVRGGGFFDGDQFPPAGTRLWDVGGVNPAINWDADTFPGPPDLITFDSPGDGTVDMNGLARTHAGLTFKNWVTYT